MPQDASLLRSDGDRLRPTPGRLAQWTVVIVAVVALLVLGSGLLIPLAVAIIIWYLINALSGLFRRIRVAGTAPPNWLALLLSLLTMLGLLAFVGRLISDNVAQVSAAAPAYEANLHRMMTTVADWAGLGPAPDLAQMIGRIDLRDVVGRIAAALSSLVADAGLILVYVAFLLVEQKTFDAKLRALYPDERQLDRVRGLLGTISARIQDYIWLKTLTSLLTGVVSYAILRLVGVDYAEFWALLIFLLNFIPTIGSLLGVVFPVVLAIVQFGSFGPVLAVLIGLGVTQIIVGNAVEPALMGRSLNLSPLGMILSLTLWGALWGIIGMFLSVPIMVIALIVCAHVPSTRRIAVLLSGDGRIPPPAPEAVEPAPAGAEHAGAGVGRAAQS